jgi:hypothetical protein
LWFGWKGKLELHPEYKQCYVKSLVAAGDIPSGKQRRRVVLEHLKVLAKRMPTESYSEIATAIDLDQAHEIGPVSLWYPLGFIRDNICGPRGLQKGQTGKRRSWFEVCDE